MLPLPVNENVGADVAVRREDDRQPADRSQGLPTQRHQGTHPI